VTPRLEGYLAGKAGQLSVGNPHDYGNSDGGRRRQQPGRSANYTAAFDAVLADAGIRTVLRSVWTPRMNAIMERWIGDVDANFWTASSSGIGPSATNPPFVRDLP
jgi:hypothetical protein